MVDASPQEDKAFRVVKYHSWVFVGILGYLSLYPLMFTTEQIIKLVDPLPKDSWLFVSSIVLVLLTLVLFLLIFTFPIFAAYRLASQFHGGFRLVLMVLSQVVPFLSFVVLILLWLQARSFLKQQGLTSGWFGVDQQSLQQRLWAGNPSD